MKDSVSYTTNSNIFQELLFMLGKMTHSDLVRKIEYLKAENRILRSRLPKKMRLKTHEQDQIIKYGLPLGASIKEVLTITSYQAFRRWLRERKLIKFRTWKPGRGRPRTKEDIKRIIIRFAKENAWGYTRILAELKKLHIRSVSRSTIKNILKEYGIEPVKSRASDTWDAFVKRHIKTLWACDFFTKTVWTPLGQKTFHVLFFINVYTRKVNIAGFTQNPTQEWVNDKARSVGFIFEGKASTQKLLMRDRDTKYSKEFDQILGSYGVDVRKVTFKSPNLNPYAESWVGTIKREFLDHFFVFGERHLRYIVLEYLRYYNTKRPHSGIGFRPPGGDISQEACLREKPFAL